jgi:hypothetical protein
MNFYEFKRWICPVNPTFVQVSNAVYSGSEEALKLAWLQAFFELIQLTLDVDAQRNELK